MNDLKIFHHTISVTSNNMETLLEAHEKSKELFPHLVTDIVVSHYNHVVTFFVAPDGGKEKKKVSNEHDNLRKEFIMKLDLMKQEGKEIHYCEVGYFEDIKEIK